MAALAGFSLSFVGNEADSHAIELYDLAEAMVGFERSLAIVTHYVINLEVIVQAPSLRGARVLASVPEAGSYKIPAIILAVGTAMSQINGLSKETHLGNLLYSAYDYVISESLGFHVDYAKTIGIQYEEYRRQNPVKGENKKLSEAGLDSVIEKCDRAIKSIHRPIVKSKSATAGIIEPLAAGKWRQLKSINELTYAFMSEENVSEKSEKIKGKISSYKMNTFKGRIFSISEERPIPFELSDSARDRNSIQKIVRSLAANAVDEPGLIELTVFRTLSKSGTLKRYWVIAVHNA